MTAKEKAKKMLTSRGMDDNYADEVLKEGISKIENVLPGYIIQWDGPMDQLPEVSYNSMWVVLSQVALKWIDKNIPEAWFRSQFI